MADLISMAILYGGRSHEHDISVLSAKSVSQKFITHEFECTYIWVSPQGKFYILQPCDYDEMERQELESIPYEHLSQYDVVFPLMHGVNVEDGTIQGLLETLQVPYVGEGVLTSSVAMDKAMSKWIAMACGVPTANFQILPVDRLSLYEDTKLQYPLFVKPMNTGSSIGISKVLHSVQMKSALKEAFKYDNWVIIEESIESSLDLEVSVLQTGENLVISDPAIIRTHGDFYDHGSKYYESHLNYIEHPAKLSDELYALIRQYCESLFMAHRAVSMMRIDFLLTKDGSLYFNEINTMPGFTPHSLYVKMLEASDLSYSEIVRALVDNAFARFDANSAKFKSLSESK